MFLTDSKESNSATALRTQLASYLGVWLLFMMIGRAPKWVALCNEQPITEMVIYMTDDT